MVRFSLRRRWAIAAAALMLTAALPIVAFEGTAAAATHSYDPAGTDYSPRGASATNPWLMPALTTTKVGVATRLFRTVSETPTDDGKNIRQTNQYRDLGAPSGWQPITSFGPAGQINPTVEPGKASFTNFVAQGNTLHTFDTTSGAQQSVFRFQVRHRMSTDGGKTWTTQWSNVDTSGTAVARGGALHFHQGIEVLPDGSWVMPVYTKRCISGANCDGKVGAQYRMVIGLLVADASSAANKAVMGSSWTKPTLPFVSPDYHYSEATVIRRSDNRLLMVGRYDPDYPASGMLGSLVFRLSSKPVHKASDLTGLEWSAPNVTVPGVKQRGPLTMGVSPKLSHVGNRIMLTFGRPGNTVAWNYDGTAMTWTDVKSLYPNTPTSCGTATNHPPCDALGSSGYMGVAVTDPAGGVGYIIGDRCHVWSCEKPGRDNWPDVNWPNQRVNSMQSTWLVRFTS
jgi:hypothetical protein